MPALFIGHGSPMNAVEENRFVKEWKALGEQIPKPAAILAVSAHWFTEGSRVSDARSPKTVYDMYGFPDALYKIVYPAKGAPELAHLAQSRISRRVSIDNSWGYDHGTWSVLHRIYPQADIPVFQLSIDSGASPAEHYGIGRELSALQKQGVLIFGSGNVVHNLARVNWGMDGGYPWAEEFDAYIKERVAARQYDDVVNYERAGASASMSIPTLDHFAPLLYVLGASENAERVSVFNDACTLGALSMTSYLFQ